MTIRQGRKAALRCPLCGRILFPTRDQKWPLHFSSLGADGRYCTRSDTDYRPAR